MQPYEECPQFDRCSCNVCPLDPLWATREALPAEEKCTARRSTRLGIAAKHGLAIGTFGLTREEVARDRKRAEAKAKWDAMPPERKAAFTRNHGKGGFMARSSASLEPVASPEGPDSPPSVEGVK